MIWRDCFARWIFKMFLARNEMFSFLFKLTKNKTGTKPTTQVFIFIKDASFANQIQQICSIKYASAVL